MKLADRKTSGINEQCCFDCRTSPLAQWPHEQDTIPSSRLSVTTEIKYDVGMDL